MNPFYHPKNLWGRYLDPSVQTRKLKWLRLMLRELLGYSPPFLTSQLIGYPVLTLQTGLVWALLVTSNGNSFLSGLVEKNWYLWSIASNNHKVLKCVSLRRFLNSLSTLFSRFGFILLIVLHVISGRRAWLPAVLGLRHLSLASWKDNGTLRKMWYLSQQEEFI